MILDITRHKFAEGLATLLLFALLAAVAAATLFSAPADIITGGGAPLMDGIIAFRDLHPAISAVALALMYVYAVLRLSRATVRVDLYPQGTMASIALAAVSLFGVVASEDYMSLIVVAILAAEAFGRLLYCFGPSSRAHYLFSSMVALGAMPLVDSSLTLLAVVLPVIVIVVRATLRETVVTLLGIALPTLLYCYVVWYNGGDFGDAFLAVWDRYQLSAHMTLAAYLDIPRLVYLAVVLFLQLATILIYITSPLASNRTMRDSWRVLILAALVVGASLFVLPAASPALVLVNVMIASVMFPLLFQRASSFASVFLYLLLIATSLVAVL